MHSLLHIGDFACRDASPRENKRSRCKMRKASGVHNCFTFLIVALSIVIAMFVVSPVYAQWPPVRVGMTNPIVDEFETLLEGTASGSEVFGIPYVQGDLVVVLDVTAGVQPPDTNGNAHSSNPVLFTTRIGEGVSPALTNPAMFGAAITPRPVGHPICIRIYNGATIEDSSFYADSQIHFVSGTEDPIVVVQAEKTSTPIDPNDDDGDGLNNSWEKSYGSDKSVPDSDGDGVADGIEHFAGTDPADGTSFMALRSVEASNDGVTVAWASSPGKSYIVECTHDVTQGSHVFIEISDPILATDELTSTEIATEDPFQFACFRVRLLDE